MEVVFEVLLLAILASYVNLVARFNRLFHSGRGGRARLAAASGMGVRVTLALIGLVSLPVSIAYLGNEGYGLLLTITSTITWLQLTSLGIGAGLQNALTEASAKGARREQLELVSTAFVALACLSALLAIAGAATFAWVNWARVFPPTTLRFVTELPVVVAIVFACFCIGLLVSAVPAVLAARQQLHVAYGAQLASGITGLVALLLAARLDWGLSGVAASVVAPSVAVNALLGCWIFTRGDTRLIRPSLRGLSVAALRRLGSKSVGFMILTLTTIAFYQTDMFILTHTVGADEVAPYGVAQRVYAQLGALFVIVTGSLWVAYGHAKAMGDAKWIRNAYLKTRRMQGMVLLPALLVMIGIGEPLLRLWVGADAAPNRELIAIVGALFVAQQWTATHAMMLNGLDVIRPQIICLLITGGVVVALSVLGALVNGSVGLALGATLGYTATAGWYLPFLVRRTLDGLSGEAR